MCATHNKETVFDPFTMTEETGHRIHLVCSWAPLLSGSLDQCLSPDDDSCAGGVAAVAAFLRFFSNGEPSLVIPFADKQSPFVQMHPVGWSVNRYILKDIMGWGVYGSTPSLLTQNSVDFDISQRDISQIQSKEMPLLLTNVAIPPSISWHPYTVPVYFDKATGLATMVVWNSNDNMNSPQVPSTKGVLDYIARLNNENGCNGAEKSYYELFTNTSNRVQDQQHPCWIPVIVYADVKENFDAFLADIIEHENPPGLIIDVDGNAPNFEEPRRLGPKDVWLVSYSNDNDEYFHHKLTLSEDRLNITDVTMIIKDLEDPIHVFNATVNVTLHDEKWRQDILALRKQADAASTNNPVVGTSTFMPITRKGNYRRCKAGECEIGNLFTDAARWWANADVAFAPSGGLRGEGWPAGDVKISNIWDALPFPNQMCTGVMSGVSLFRVINYSVNAATFEGENTSDGDKLLQVSGMKVTYNLKLEKGNRLISIDVYDRAKKRYMPLERLKLYKFSTDSFMCGGFDEFPSLLGEQLVLPGEEPGSAMEGSLFQNVVRDYLSSLSKPYEVDIMDRLVNNTLAEESLNLVQTAADCVEGSFWREEFSTCTGCPEVSLVSFLSKGVEFNAVEGYGARILGEVVMVNTELFDITVVPKTKPPWLTYSGAVFSSTGGRFPLFEGLETPLRPGERMTINLAAEVREENSKPGIFQAGAFFRVSPSGRDYPGCAATEIAFETVLNISPEPELNQLGSIRVVGWVLAPLVTLTALFFIGWVLWNRKLRIVKTLQPMFLVMIAVGALIMGLTIIPLSLDDEIVSERGCSIACMSMFWLLSMGFTIAMSALFSKLWRINKLFHNPGLRRMKVTEKDVMKPFIVLFSLNSIALVIWTVLDPLEWVRVEVDGEPWNTFGACRSSPEGNGTVTIIMLSLVIAVNILALIVAGYQAYQARNISDEFSESKTMGVALFSWFQLMIVGFPVLYLIDEDNPSARYFLNTLLVFAVSMSMLLLIFVPILLQTYEAKREENDERPEGRPREERNVSSYSLKKHGTVRVSGLDASGRSDSRSPGSCLRKMPRNTHSYESESGIDSLHSQENDSFLRETYGLGESTTSIGVSGAMKPLKESSEEIIKSEEYKTPLDSPKNIPPIEQRDGKEEEPTIYAIPAVVACSEEFQINESTWNSDEGFGRDSDIDHIFGKGISTQPDPGGTKEAPDSQNEYLNRESQTEDASKAGVMVEAPDRPESQHMSISDRSSIERKYFT